MLEALVVVILLFLLVFGFVVNMNMFTQSQQQDAYLMAGLIFFLAVIYVYVEISDPNLPKKNRWMIAVIPVLAFVVGLYVFKYGMRTATPAQSSQVFVPVEVDSDGNIVRARRDLGVLV